MNVSAHSRLIKLKAFKFENNTKSDKTYSTITDLLEELHKINSNIPSIYNECK